MYTLYKLRSFSRADSRHFLAVYIFDELCNLKVPDAFRVPADGFVEFCWDGVSTKIYKCAFKLKSRADLCTFVPNKNVLSKLSLSALINCGELRIITGFFFSTKENALSS